MKRAGRAVELRPAPKARKAAHPQERQHSAAEGGTRTECARPKLSMCGARAAPRRQSSPDWDRESQCRTESTPRLAAWRFHDASTARVCGIPLVTNSP